MNGPISNISRRSILVGAAGVLVTPMVMRPSRAVANSGSVTLTSYGGSFQEILQKQVVTAFTEQTGIQVNMVPAPDLARIKAQLAMGNVEWDIWDGAASEGAFGSKQGFWDKLDSSLFDVEDMSIPPHNDRVTWEIYAGGITWDPEKYGPGKHPTNFAEWFDLKKFPGRRAISNNVRGGALEVALLADGVASKDIYPLDLDRAFKVLDRIKSNMVWTAATPQTISLVQTGEVDFSVTYSNRAAATAQPGGGKTLAFSFEQNTIYSEEIAVLKGAPNKENAMKLVAYFLRPEVQARVMNVTALIPVSKKAVPMLSAKVRKWQPDLSNPNNLTIDNAYWAENFDAVSRRFKEWMLH